MTELTSAFGSPLNQMDGAMNDSMNGSMNDSSQYNESNNNSHNNQHQDNYDSEYNNGSYGGHNNEQTLDIFQGQTQGNVQSVQSQQNQSNHLQNRNNNVYNNNNNNSSSNNNHTDIQKAQIQMLKSKLYKLQKHEENQQKRREMNNDNDNNNSIFEQFGAKRRDALKLVLISLAVLLALGFDSLIKHYMKDFLQSPDITDQKEMYLRLAYPVGIFFILWSLKVFNK